MYLFMIFSIMTVVCLVLLTIAGAWSFGSLAFCFLFSLLITLAAWVDKDADNIYKY